MKILSSSYTTEIIVHVWLIMTTYVAITTSSLLLQRQLSAVRLHIARLLLQKYMQSSVTIPVQRQCYPDIAIGDKDSYELLLN